MDNAKTQETSSNGTPFDDVYRTLTVKTKRLMIPLINYMFKQNYPMDIHIETLSNEAFNSENDKLFTDARFAIGDKDDEIYNIFIVEEQTNTDKQIPMRLYEYMLAHASMSFPDTYNKGKIVIPSVGVLNLRGKNDIVPMRLVHTNGEIDVSMKNLSMKDLENLDYIAKHKLYCLTPYHAFSIEKKLRQADNEEAKELYREKSEKCLALLKKAQEEGDISVDEEYVLMELRNSVISSMNFGENDKSIKEMAKMGRGKVLTFEYEDMFKELAEKFKQSKEELKKSEQRGEEKATSNIIIELLKAKQPVSLISQVSKYSIDKIMEIGKNNGIAVTM